MIPLAAVAMASLLAVAIINARLATRQTRTAIASQLEGVVGVLTNSNFPLTEAVLKQMKGLSGAEFVLVSDQGDLLSASRPGLADRLPVAPRRKIDSTLSLGPQVLIDNESYFHSVLQLRRPHDMRESVWLHVLFPREQYDAAWRSAFLPPLVVGIGSLAAVALVTQWIAGRISRNLATLGASVVRLARGEFQPIVVPDRDDEVRDLVVAVNQTALRLTEYEQHVRQTEQVRTIAMLGAGLAHEMRNAATGCRLAVDLHVEGCPSKATDDTLAVAKSQLQLMESRLQSFLQLGREAPDSQFETFDFVALVSELVPLVLPAARHAGVRVDWQPAPATVHVVGRRASLQMVVVNLLLNAIEAAQKNAAGVRQPCVGVQICEQYAGVVELEVSDTGTGLPPDVASRLFEPFVTTKPEGVGLGLAVARQVARTHGGHIDCHRTGNRTYFRLSLPLAGRSNGSERNGTHA